MRTILVPIGGGDADAVVLETALAAARPLSAHLEFLLVRVAAAEAARYTPHVDFARGAGLSSALDGLRSRAERRSATAERNIRDFCARHDIEMVEAPFPAQSVTARWQRDEGDAMQRLLFHARHNDLVVMARPTGLDGLPPDRLESLLVGCGRPLLIPPQGAPMRGLGTVMVCWKETRDAARAVSTAMPLLTKARRVVVVSVNEDTGEALSEAVGGIVRELAWNGIAAEAHVPGRERGTTADTLFAAARTFAADLMVMGAYGHRHLREVLFGGCTQNAIEAAQCAVFLVH
jgi:nucleotide-binding universal stress UspA family protein